MSIEQDLGRIATALETLVVLVSDLKGIPSPIKPPLHEQEINQALSKPEPKVTAKAPDVAPATPAAKALPTVKSTSELRELAQKIGVGVPKEKIEAFTNFVRNEINARLGVKQLKEIDGAENFEFAVSKLMEYAKQEGINV